MIDWNNPPTRPTRWQLIKSWWYWKVSSKYGFDDFVMYIVFPAMILGLLSLELRDSKGKNLSGYMIVENDLPTLGDMHFYQVPLNSTTKLIGPTAVREALEKDNDFAQLKTLLRTPRIGDNILYRVGEHDVYFIPVYTAGSGEGVVAQLGTIAAVGAAFNGEYYVGPSYNYLDSIKRVYNIDAAEHYAVGTLEDIERYRDLYGNKTI